MAFNVAKLLNSDWQFDRRVFFGRLDGWNEADKDENFANYETDEDDDFDFRQNYYDTAMEVANRSVEMVSDSPDEELWKANEFRYLSLLF